MAWMDHEFFTEPPNSNLAGWDWFAIQLQTMKTDALSLAVTNPVK